MAVAAVLRTGTESTAFLIESTTAAPGPVGEVIEDTAFLTESPKETVPVDVACPLAGDPGPLTHDLPSSLTVVPVGHGTLVPGGVLVPFAPPGLFRGALSDPLGEDIAGVVLVEDDVSE